MQARPEFQIKLWDIESGQEMRTLVGQETDVHTVAFSPDGALLASVGPMAEAKLWDVESGQVIRDLRGHNGNVFGIGFSSDDPLLASSSDDGTVKLWDVETGRVLRSLRHNSERRIGYRLLARWLTLSVGWPWERDLSVGHASLRPAIGEDGFTVPLGQRSTLPWRTWRAPRLTHW